MKHRATLLPVIVSSCEVHPEIGIAPFDWFGFSKSDFCFSELLDTLVEHNHQIVEAFRKEQGVRRYPSKRFVVSGCSDNGVRDVAEQQNRHCYGYTECASRTSAVVSAGGFSWIQADIYTVLATGMCSARA